MGNLTASRCIARASVVAMRWWLVVAMAGCGTTSPVGTVTVTVYSNAFRSTDFVTEGKPLAGVLVFEDGGRSVMTDDSGEATLSILHDPATVHVAGSSSAALTTIAGVPEGGHAYVGNRPIFMHVGVTTVTLQDIGATSYDVAAPACMSHGGVTGNQVGFTYDSSCGNTVVHLVGEAVTSAGTKVVEQDVPLTPNTAATLGAFSDATLYAPMPTNAPTLADPLEVMIGVVGPQGMELVLPSLAGPADANRVILVSGSSQSGSRLAVDGPIGATVDASHMIPVPELGTVDTHGAAWSIPASAAQPNLVELDVHYGNATWTAYAPPSQTTIRFPHLPAALASLAPSGAPTSVELHVYELPRAALTNDELAGSFDGLTAPLRADHQPIAASQVMR